MKSKTLSLIEARLVRAKSNKDEKRLFSVLRRYFPQTPSDLLNYAIQEYLECVPNNLEFGDEVAVIPGQHEPFSKIGDLERIGVIDDAVSIDFLWVLDDVIPEKIFATGPVGKIGFPIPMAHEYANETEVSFASEEHPVVSFEVRDFYDENFLTEKEDRLEVLGEEATHADRFGVLSLSVFEDWQIYAIIKTIKFWLRSLKEEVLSWSDHDTLSSTLLKLIYEDIGENPRIYRQFLSFNLIRIQAKLMYENEDMSPRRRRIYSFMSNLPDIDESDPSRLRIHKDAKKLFIHEVPDVSSKMLPKPQTAKILNFKKVAAPRCDLCEAEMVRRENRRSGQSFWGCSNFPKCRGTKKIEE